MADGSTGEEFDWTITREWRGMVTPRMAKSWLDHNTLNRRLRPKRVLELVRAIESGQWQYTGESISFDTNGVLSNGQHRLAAIVASGIACEALVVFGLSPSARLVQDMCDPRKPAQTIAMMSTIPMPNAQTEWMQTTLRIFIARHEKATPKEVISRYAADKENIDWLLAKRKVGHGRLYGAAVFSVFLLAMRQHQAAVRRFVTRYCSGTGLLETDPEYMLRESLINESTGGGSAQTMIAERAAGALFAAIDGRPMRRLVRSESALMRLRPEVDRLRPPPAA